MKLSRQEADLFFELMWALQSFVNQNLRLHPEIATLEDYRACSSETKLSVRRALFASPELIDAFIEKNPQGYAEDRLAVIAGWKHVVAGEFYIERLLKKHAVFISGDDRVYGVLALHDGFQDIVPRSLPFLVKAVLLPFKGKIIYDGLLEGYNVSFGRGISAGLKESYLAAKQRGRIIESLPEGAQAPAKGQREAARDWRPELDELVARAEKLRGGSGQPPLNSAAFRLVKASLALARTAAQDPDDLAGLWSALKKVAQAAARVERSLERAKS
ncbi:hypothetical protein BH24DEI1_BH24DEI1_20170 [soil metagenome]|jgi:hypothetical protein|nr:hypothetical protein [Deinococcota bacterium]